MHRDVLGDAGNVKLASNGKVPFALLADRLVNVITDFNAIGDGTYHPLSERYSTLAAAQVDYPCSIALTDSIDWAAIQTAVDVLDTYNQGDPTLGSSYSTGQRGGEAFLPLAVYWINRSIYTEARIRLVGQLGGAAGGKSSLLRADPAGDYTNGPYTEKFLLKVGRRNTGTYWWHSGSLELLELDCNQASGLAGFHCWGSGENSLIDRVFVTRTGWTNRTKADVTFTADSKIIVSNTAAFTQDDVSGIVTPNDSTGFPTTWPADVTVADAAASKGLDVISSPGGNFTAAMKGMEWLQSGQGIYVKAYISATQLQMSEPMAVQGALSFTLTRPRGLRIERVVDATHAWLTREALTGGSGASVTFQTPRPAVQYQDGGATMNIRSLACFENSGHGLEIINGTQGWIEISGDNNGGSLVRLRDCGNGGDCGTFDVKLKGENNDYNAGNLDNFSRHNPVVLMDGCGGVHLNLSGHVSASDRGTRTVVRIDRKAGFAAGFPSVTLDLTGSNPYNTEFRYGILDTDTGRRVDTPFLADTNGGQMTPLVLWNRPIVMGGDYGDTLRLDDLLLNIRRIRSNSQDASQRIGTEPWRVSIPFGNTPNAQAVGTWTSQYLAAAWGTILGFNNSNAQNDDMRWFLNLSKGTWRLDLNGYKGADRAITTFDISYNGGSSYTTIGTVDLYAASGSIAPASFTSIAVPDSGRCIFRARALTRNVSNTTGWIMAWSQGEFIRTA